MPTPLERLDAKLNELIIAYQHLQLENDTLRKKESHLVAKCQELMGKNETAAEKVKQILTRLKTLEKAS